MITSRKIAKIDDGKYVINFEFQWQNAVAGKLFLNGLFPGFYGGVEDAANMLDVNSNVAIPPIKAVQGTINFQSELTGVGGGVGPVMIIAPDTQEILAISRNINSGGLSGAQGSYVIGTPVPGAVGHDFVSFCAPIHSASKSFRVMKLEEPPDGSAIMHGYGNINFLTFDAAPYNLSF